MCMSVDLPEPEGPMIATIWPFSIVEVDPAQRLHRELARVVGLGDALHADERGDGHGGVSGARRHRRQ